MKFLQYSIISIMAITTLTSCGKSGYDFKLNTTKLTSLDKKININLQQISDENIDSVKFYVNEKEIPAKNNASTIDASEVGIGKHIVTALIFNSNTVKKVIDSVKVFSDKKPLVYSYKVINEFPHDTAAYTQGLEFYKGHLYETTGRYGTSWLRKVDYKTGKVLQQKDLSKNYFGEGMTITNNQIYWITWLGTRGFNFNPETFEQTGDFKYNKSVQGWGLTHNETNLIKTDGTNKIWFLKYNGEEDYAIQTATNNALVKRLNEIEYVDGKIYANHWVTKKPIPSTILIIDSKTGIVEGLVDLKKLRSEIAKSQTLNEDEVLNGIAYNTDTKTFFVTGKHWGKLFEIEITKP